MQIVIKNQALEHFFDECAREFQAACPGLAKTLDEHVAGQNAALRNPDGFSNDGTFMLRACIPQFMYAFLKQQARKRLGLDDVWRDPRNLRTFLRCWTRCKVKTKPKERYKCSDLTTSPSPP